MTKWAALREHSPPLSASATIVYHILFYSSIVYSTMLCYAMLYRTASATSSPSSQGCTRPRSGKTCPPLARWKRSPYITIVIATLTLVIVITIKIQVIIITITITILLLLLLLLIIMIIMIVPAAHGKRSPVRSCDELGGTRKGLGSCL